jgi:hypothetical protein
MKKKTNSTTFKSFEIESKVVSEPIFTAFSSKKNNTVSVQEPTSISATDSAKLAFKKLSEKYNCTFDNKYTR